MSQWTSKETCLQPAILGPPGMLPATESGVMEVLTLSGQRLLEPLAPAACPPISRIPAVSCLSRGPGGSHSLPSASHVRPAVPAVVSTMHSPIFHMPPSPTRPPTVPEPEQTLPLPPPGLTKGL